MKNYDKNAQRILRKLHRFPAHIRQRLLSELDIKEVARILFLADLHCGSPQGMCSPNFTVKALEKFQNERWSWYENVLKLLGPFDFVINGGDNMDGSGRKHGDPSRIAEPFTQVKMAYECMCSAFTPGITRGIYMAGGTPCHVRTNDGEIDLEKVLAEELLKMVSISGGKVDLEKVLAKELLKLTPNVFQCEKVEVEYEPTLYLAVKFKSVKRAFHMCVHHYTSKGSLRTGGAAMGARRNTSEMLQAEILDGRPTLDCILFAHAHEYSCSVVIRKDRMTPLYTITAPALQGSGSNYGQLFCLGKTDFGLIVLDLIVKQDDSIELHVEPVTVKLKQDQPVIHTLHVP